MSNVLEHSWYSKHWLNWALKPLAWLFGFVSAQRKRLQQKTWSKSRLPVPVIVVGNISVGGTGKTPLLIALVRRLRDEGYRPGVISRGYGGKAESYPMMVTAASRPSAAGDEPVLIASQADCPVVVDPDRLSAAMYLLTHSDCNIVLSDDGLQHYRLPRDIEIAVVDGQRGFGNGQLMPAGPLREPIARLQSVDLVVVNGRQSTVAANLLQGVDSTVMAVKPSSVLRALNGKSTIKTRDWPFTRRSVHAVAGIGNPQRFVDTLTALGFQAELRRFPDHHKFNADDLSFGDDRAVIMTAKDAVKCQTFATDDQWVLDVTAELPEQWYQTLLAKIVKASSQRSRSR